MLVSNLYTQADSLCNPRRYRTIATFAINVVRRDCVTWQKCQSKDKQQNRRCSFLVRECEGMFTLQVPCISDNTLCKALVGVERLRRRINKASKLSNEMGLISITSPRIGLVRARQLHLRSSTQSPPLAGEQPW